MIKKAAVLLITFNRPDYTREVIASLRKAKVEKLYIFKDGPRKGNLKDTVAHDELIQLFDTIDWPCECSTNISITNLGCGLGVSSAVSWAFEKEDRLIILEDDCVPAQAFFGYCDQMLERFLDDQRVWSVSGENHYYPEWGFRGCDYLFSQYGYNAGWATWKRCWEHFDFEMKALPAVLQDKVFYDLFSDVKIANTYQKRFSKLQQMNTTPSFWTAQFGLQVVLHRGLFVIPRKNLIKNIGLVGDHTNSKNEYHNVESEEDFRVEKHPAFVIPSRALMLWHYRHRIRRIYNDMPLGYRIGRKLMNAFSRGRRLLTTNS